MAQGPTYRVKFRRRREGKTNYYRRRRLLLSRKLRVVVRRSNTRVTVQIIEAAVGGDMTRASATSEQLQNFGWEAGTSNLPAAYLTGLLAGRRAKINGVEEAVLDIGLNPPVKGCKIYAALKGVLDAGVVVPHSEEALPDEERLSGKHIVKSFEYYSGQKEKSLMFSSIAKKKKTAISGLPKTFGSVKKAMMDASDAALQAKVKRAVEAEVPKKKAVSKRKAEKPAEKVPRAVPRKPKPKKLVAGAKRKKPKKEEAEAAAAPAATDTTGASGTPTEGQ